MSATARPVRRSVLESPWYWVYAFSAAALVAMTLIGPKFQARQAQIERQSQGRIAAARQQPASEAAEAPRRSTQVSSLAIGLSLLLVLSWFVVWWQHFRRGARRPAPQGAAATEAAIEAATDGAVDAGSKATSAR